MLFWFVMCPLQGESEAEKEIGEGEENQGENDFPNEEKEGLKGGFDLGFFA